MRYGIAILPEHTWSHARTLWTEAEELGFDHAWTYDHVVWGGLPESEWFGAVPTLTAAATVTSRIALGLFVASPNFRHPVPFARDLQGIADISGDRLLIGLGAGGDPDASILGDEPLSPGRRVDRLQEFTELLDRVLSTDHVTSQGRYFSTTDMRLRGEPIRPRNPLLLAGNGPRSVDYAARTGDGWITTGPHATDLDEWFDAVAVSSAQLDESLEPGGPITRRVPDLSEHRHIPGDVADERVALRRHDRAGRRTRLQRRHLSLAPINRSLRRVRRPAPRHRGPIHPTMTSRRPNRSPCCRGTVG